MTNVIRKSIGRRGCRVIPISSLRQKYPKLTHSKVHRQALAWTIFIFSFLSLPPPSSWSVISLIHFLALTFHTIILGTISMCVLFQSPLIYLTVTTANIKSTDHGSNDRVFYGVVSMQGWRPSKFCPYLSIPFLIIFYHDRDGGRPCHWFGPWSPKR